MKKKGITLVGIFLLVLVLVGSIVFQPKNVTTDSYDREDNDVVTNQNTPIEREEKVNVSQNEKLNLYLFWGEGCPHCEKLISFFKGLPEDYTSLFILHTFEVWKNDDNKKLMKAFGELLNQNVSGVPFLIVGSQVFVGYTSSKDELIKLAIQEEYNKEIPVDYYNEAKALTTRN